MKLTRIAPTMALLAVAATLVAFRSAEPAGPPWISLEAPANPLNPATRDAAFVVRTYRHDRAEAVPISGSAVGIVNGQRQEVPLEFESVGGVGVFGVSQTWPSEGQWVLTIGVGDGATMIVELTGSGGLEHTSYYGKDAKRLSLSSVQVLDRAPSDGQITRRLNALALAASP